MDNGPEFVAKLSRQWRVANEIEFKYIQPGKPTQNAYVVVPQKALQSFTIHNLYTIMDK
ncbi:MAG: hypothetical protein IPJ81_12955 [Chitinophagaceae bacterium]|nr:hypothetical protein [Chitinophagaceae bacterium]